jgi:hypothetical protein
MRKQSINHDLMLLAVIARLYGCKPEALGLYDTARCDPTPGVPLSPDAAQSMLRVAGVETIDVEHSARGYPHWLTPVARRGQVVLCYMRRDDEHATDWWAILGGHCDTHAALISLTTDGPPVTVAGDWDSRAHNRYLVALQPIPGWDPEDSGDDLATFLSNL